MSQNDLNAAYALAGPDDCRRLYADWADSYDADFAAGMDYQLPAHVAAAYLAAGGGTAETVLDVGAGTGLLGAALRGAGFAGTIDGVDLSAAMLARAGALNLYRRLAEADITQPLPAGLGPYGGLVSSGTFTHGHVGPQALPHLLAIAGPDALFALSVNQGVWDSLGFADALGALPIHALATAQAPIYGPRATARDPGHAADRAMIVTFRKD